MAAGRYKIDHALSALGSGLLKTQSVSVRAVLKYNDKADAPYCVPNELICGQIGHFLGLPFPPGGIIEDPKDLTRPGFISLNFNPSGDEFPPVEPSECVNRLPDLSAGLLLFDILVANNDRNKKNISVDWSISPPRMYAFDHGHALFGAIPDGGQERLNEMRDRLGVSEGMRIQGLGHCLLKYIDTDQHFEKWLKWISLLPDFLIEDLCREAMSYGINQAEAESAIDFLKYRREHLAVIIRNNKGEFRGIQWSPSP